MKNLVIGLGTGRCGTTSLAHLLNAQPDSTFVHEGLFSGKKYDHFLLPWEVNYSKFLEWEKKVQSLEGNFCGDVGSYMIQYVDVIIKRHPHTKFICLERDRREVIESFMIKTRGRNHWSLNPSFREFKDPIWDPIFPKFFAKKREAIGLYWDAYYTQARELQSKYPENFKIFPTGSLNFSCFMLGILSFAGFSYGEMVFERKHENKNRLKDEIGSILTPIKNVLKKPQNY